MALESKALRFFVQVAHYGSLSQAARSLNMVQPALSHHIGNLERELGTSLFSRKAHGVVLTEAGQSLMPYAVSVIRLLDEAEQDMARQSESVAGTVRIGFSGSAGILLIPLLLQEAKSRLPDVRLQLVENFSSTLRDWVKTDRVDMAISVAPSVEGAMGRETVPLVEEPLYLVGKPEILPGEGDMIAFAHIADAPLILTEPGNSVRMAVEQEAAEQGFSIKPTAEVTGLSVLKAALASGIGNAVLSRCAVIGELQEGSLAARQITAPAIERTIMLDYHKHNPVRKAEVAIRRLLMELIESLIRNRTLKGKVLFDMDD